MNILVEIATSTIEVKSLKEMLRITARLSNERVAFSVKPENPYSNIWFITLPIYTAQRIKASFDFDVIE